jgi:outer membrane protein TolC
MPDVSPLTLGRSALLLALAVAGAGLAGCESPFADAADRTAYPLIARRQQESLGTTSEMAVARQMVPLPVTPQVYEKVPHTENRIPTPAELSAATQPATQPGTPQTVATAPGAATQPDPLAALLAATPPIDLQNQPELPAFPRPVAPGRTRLTFSLDDAFNYALEHSRDYQLRKEDLYIEALNVVLARHQFEPRLFATTSADFIGRGESSDFQNALSASQSIGVRQRLPYGGEVVASGLVSAVNELRSKAGDSESATAVLQANIPLLRGAGIVAQEDLIQSERNLVYEVRDFERYRRAFLVQVAQSYFNLVNQRAQVLNRFRSVQSYIFITQRTAALFEAGVGRRRVTQLDLQRARQSEFQARNDLTNAIQQYESAIDTFKILLGMPAEQPLDVAPQYLDISPPEITEAAAVEIAQRLRLDLQTRRDQVADARRKNKVAANNLLPDLRVNGRAAMSTDPNTKSIALQGRETDYAAGISLDLPLDRLAEQNAYRVSMINIARAERTVELNEDQVAIDVRDSLRRVRQQQYLVGLQRANIDLASRRKEFADIQFKNGEIDNRDYLDAETALLDAQNRFAQSVSALQVATLQFLRDTDQLRVDPRGRLLVPGSAAGVSTGVTERVGGTDTPPDLGKPLPALVPTTRPVIPDPDPRAPTVGP